MKRRARPEQTLQGADGRFLKVSAQERFHRHYARGAEDDCWLWTGKKHQFGYGFFFPTRDRAVTAHRFSWEIHCGPIPVGMLVCHRCDVPGCVNPAHLFLGTTKDNCTDKTVKGRAARKLTAIQAASIRFDRRSLREIAADYGVSRPTVSEIRRGKTWKHVP